VSKTQKKGEKDPTSVSPPRVLAISDRKGLAALSDWRWEDWVEAVASAGLQLLIREKDLGDRDLLQLVRRTRSRFPGQLLVSSRPDVARAGDADGVHLPELGLPASAVRRLWPDAVIGWSLHSPAGLDSYELSACDYVTFSPIRATSSKPSSQPVGFENLASFCREASIRKTPVLALGGMDAASSQRALEAGASGVAAIGSTQTPPGLLAWRSSIERWADLDLSKPAIGAP
jgi:thiamine-phosphate pyrophosphorylase